MSGLRVCEGCGRPTRKPRTLYVRAGSRTEPVGMFGTTCFYRRADRLRAKGRIPANVHGRTIYPRRRKAANR